MEYTPTFASVERFDDGWYLHLPGCGFMYLDETDLPHKKAVLRGRFYLSTRYGLRSYNVQHERDGLAYCNIVSKTAG